MFILVLLLFFTAFLFYGFIPGLGAFIIRSQWYRFRQRLINSTHHPIAQPGLFSKNSLDGYLGEYRFFGKLESIQGDNRLWITDSTMTIGLDVEQLSLFLLRSYPVDVDKTNVEHFENTIPDDEPDYLPWKKIYSLPSGIRIFVAGHLYQESGQFIFKQKEKEDLLIVIHDGKKQTLLKRSIWSGRHKNEYLNQFTPVSVACGSLILLLISYFLLQNPTMRFAAAASIMLSTFPISYLLPPGVFLYFLYRHFWKQARSLRSERDLFLLPLRFFNKDEDFKKNEIYVHLPNGEEYGLIKWRPGAKNSSFTLNPEMKIRMTSLNQFLPEENVNYVFGIKDNTRLKESTDPMVEFVCIAGNPKELAKQCNNKSKLLGITAALCIFTGIIINFFLIFFGINFFIFGP
ncbi:MAG: hypothetical protein JW904_00375 [Spirochaetales bacterium]|nr:hypothetical protein [Spirochaetales bacterium]